MSGDKKSKHPLFKWKTESPGREALCHILLYAENMAGGQEALLRATSYSDMGITAESLFKHLEVEVPQLKEAFLRRTGRELTPKIVYARFTNMFEPMPNGSRVPTSEYPRSHSDVVGTFLRVSGQQMDMFLGNP